VQCQKCHSSGGGKTTIEAGIQNGMVSAKDKMQDEKCEMSGESGESLVENLKERAAHRVSYFSYGREHPSGPRGQKLSSVVAQRLETKVQLGLGFPYVLAGFSMPHSPPKTRRSCRRFSIPLTTERQLPPAL